MNNKNASAGFGWLVLYIGIIAAIAYNVIKFLANKLGSSESAGVRAFGAVIVVAIISLSIFLIIRLFGGRFK